MKTQKLTLGKPSKHRQSLVASFDPKLNRLTLQTKTGEVVYIVHADGEVLNVRCYPSVLGNGMLIAPEAGNSVNISIRSELLQTS